MRWLRDILVTSLMAAGFFIVCEYACAITDLSRSEAMLALIIVILVDRWGNEPNS